MSIQHLNGPRYTDPRMTAAPAFASQRSKFGNVTEPQSPSLPVPGGVNHIAPRLGEGGMYFAGQKIGTRLDIRG